jgi:hypothetical protein
MWTIYFISSLDTIIIASIVAAIICGFIIFFGSFIGFVEEEERALHAAKKAILPFIISFTIAIFTPSTQAAFAMYGVGKIIDYVKENKELTNLPDKCIKALDIWLDKQLEEEK